ncbi:hypothetical protein IKF84_03175 [Candidatus Saccharibacteria bacterium]|nr:hypothetical protein [Candidatus Saccharibacteria bacterium]
MKKRPSKKVNITVFVIGMIVLVAGLAVLIIKKTAQPLLDDAEFLITAGNWVREDQPSVIWDFSEVGKGKLTTDDHLNDYDFIWRLQDKKLLIETSWLYDLNNEFDYTIDQGEKTLVITNQDKNIEIKFNAVKKPAEDTES